jgi:phosphoglycolate phosphatase
VLGQREGVPAKPSPRIVFEILHKTGVSTKETLYVGDSGVDMQTAFNSGIVSIGVTWGFRPRSELERAGAKQIVDSPSEILDFIEN